MFSEELEGLRNSEGRIDVSSIYEYDTGIKGKIKLDDAELFWKKKKDQTYSDLTEVLVSILARQIGLPTARYELAECDEVEGVISYSVADKTDTIIDYNNFLFSHLPSHMKDYQATTSIMDLYETLKSKIASETITKTEANELLRQHVTLLIFDVAIINTDRHNKNLLILEDEKNTIRLAPALDNEMSFLAHFPTHIISGYLKSGKLEAVVKNQVTVTNNILTIDSKTNSITNYLLNLSETKYLFPELFEKTINKVFNLDIEKAIEIMETEQKTKLPEDYKEWVSLTFNTRLENIKDKFFYCDFIKPQHKDLEV